MLADIQTNVENILIFKKFVEKYFKTILNNTTNISNITKYVENLNPHRSKSTRFFIIYLSIIY